MFLTDTAQLRADEGTKTHEIVGFFV